MCCRFQGRVRAELDYREPIDLGEGIELVTFDSCVALVTSAAVKAVARVTPT